MLILHKSAHSKRPFFLLIVSYYVGSGVRTALVVAV